MPFLLGPRETTLRYQQVYGASDFSAIANGGGYITGIGVAISPDGGPCCVNGRTLGSTEIHLSTTTHQPDNLSTVFAENIGANEAIVFGPSSFRIQGAPGAGVIVIPFTVPFFYQPGMGNLLLDVRNYIGADGPTFPNSGGAFSQMNRFGDTVSRVSAFDVNATSGTLSTEGLLTMFMITPVPDLAVALVSSNMVFRWDLPPVEFTLQQSEALGSCASWQPANGIVTTNRASNGIYYVEVTLPLDPLATARFFRLTSQPSSPGAAETQTTVGLNQQP